MTADLAALYLYLPSLYLFKGSHQSKYEKATLYLKKLCVKSANKSWSSIDCALMRLYAQCLQKTGDINGHITVLLRLLGHRPEIGPIDGKQYVDELEEELQHLNSSTLFRSIPLIIVRECSLRDYFILQIGARAAHRENEDGFTINVILQNLFPRTITLDEVKVKVTSVLTHQELWFTAENVYLEQGKNEVQTTCNITAPGVYIFEKAVLRWHSLVFQQEFVEMGRKQSLSIYPHGNALHVSAEMAGESNTLKG